MNHRTQIHSSALIATPNHKDLLQMPSSYVDANFADERIEIQMTNTVLEQISTSEQTVIHILDADLADRRVEIQKDERLRFTLMEWENTLRQSLGTVQYRKTGCINAKTELYQLIGFYTVFQGVVLTAAITSSLLRCQTSWGPAALSLLVSVAAIPAVHDRLTEYNALKSNLFWDEEHSKVMSTKVRMLQRKGASFDFTELEGIQDETLYKKREQQFHAQSRKCDIVKWLTTSYLCVFSTMIFGCCFIIPCWTIIAKS